MLFRHEYYLSGNMRFERVFCFNRLILFVPRIPEGKPCEFTASRKNYSPHIRAWIGWIDWLKTPSQKSTNFVVQCIWPRFFRYDDFINFCYFSFFKNVWSMANFRKVCIIFISVPKTLISSDHVHLNQKKLETNKLTKNLCAFIKHKLFSLVCILT